MVAVELSKIIVVVINVIFLLFGLASLIVGIVFKVGWDDVRDAFIDLADDVDVDLRSAGDVLGYGGIIFGSFIIVVSLLGCIGACCKVRVLLALYAIILLILVIGEVTIVALVATHVDKTESEIGKVLDKSLEGYHEDSSDSDPRWKSFSAIFNKLECCGVNNYSESFPYNKLYNNNTFIPSNLRNLTAYPPKIPITCCKGFDYQAELKSDSFKEKGPCLTDPKDSNAYVQGCLPTIIEKIKDNKGILIGVGVAILVLELLMIFIAFFLCCRHDKD